MSNNKKFKKMIISSRDQYELRSALNIISIQNYIIVSGRQTVSSWQIRGDVFEKEKVIFDCRNSAGRWDVFYVTAIEDDPDMILIAVSQGYVREIIIWNVHDNYCKHRSTVLFSAEHIIPLTSSLLYLLDEDTKPLIITFKKQFHYDTILHDNISNELCKINNVTKLKQSNKHIVVLSNNRTLLSIWKVTNDKYKQISSYNSEYLQDCVALDCISKSVLILTLFQGKLIVRLSNDKKMYGETYMRDFYFSEILTNFSSSLLLVLTTDVNDNNKELYQLVNIDKNINSTGHILVSNPYGNDKQKCSCVYLKDKNCILVLTYDSFSIYKFNLPHHMVTNIKYSEIKKNARVISQAIRTKSSVFQNLPVEICLHIIAMTRDKTITYLKAKNCAFKYFCKPLTLD